VDQLTANRAKSLYEADAGTRQTWEDAQATALQDMAALKSAQAALATARLDLQRTVLTSPISGRVDTSTVTVGTLVTASQTTALTTVNQINPIYVDIPQSSVDVLKLRTQLAQGTLTAGDLAIHLKLEDGSAYPLPGKLKVSGVAVNTTSGAVTLRAEVPNPDGLLLPGMYVRAVLDQARDPAAILVPQAGVARDASGKAVSVVVDTDGKVVKRNLVVADVIDGQWRVTDGLKAGDRVIMEGSSKVQVGQVVHAVPFKN
jgi:membrane fusion protein (multidrug efflux system)